METWRKTPRANTKTSAKHRKQACSACEDHVNMHRQPTCVRGSPNLMALRQALKLKMCLSCGCQTRLGRLKVRKKRGCACESRHFLAALPPLHMGVRARSLVACLPCRHCSLPPRQRPPHITADHIYFADSNASKRI